MSSEIDKLIEVVTELVLQELESASGASAPAPSPPAAKPKAKGVPVLVAPGPTTAEDSFWKGLTKAEGISPSVLIWNGMRQDQLPSQCSRWKIEARTTHWERVASPHKGVVLLGSDLAVLGSLASFGGDGNPPAGAATAALAGGKPVFVDNTRFEALRRHSSRLSPGFVRRFEELFRIVNSFGVEFGGAPELQSFLGRLGGSTAKPDSAAARSGGRDVITVEDLEAVRRAGQTRLPVVMGTIVTPLAAQKAREWGIEVIFQ